MATAVPSMSRDAVRLRIETSCPVHPRFVVFDSVTLRPPPAEMREPSLTADPTGRASTLALDRPRQTSWAAVVARAGRSRRRADQGTAHQWDFQRRALDTTLPPITKRYPGSPR